MVVLGQKWIYSSKSCCIRAKVVLRHKLVVFGNKVVFGQKWLYSGKSCYIRVKLLYLGKSESIRAKVVVFGQK